MCNTCIWPKDSFQQGVRSPHVLGGHLDRVDRGGNDSVTDANQKSGDEEVPNGAGHPGAQPTEGVGKTADHQNLKYIESRLMGLQLMWSIFYFFTVSQPESLLM
jgi:hypothetical protein